MVKSESDFKPQPLYGHLTIIYIWLHLVTIGHFLQQLLRSVSTVTPVKSGHSCNIWSQLFTYGHNWSHMVTPVTSNTCLTRLTL